MGNYWDNYCGSVSYGPGHYDGSCPNPNYLPLVIFILGGILFMFFLFAMNKLFPNIPYYFLSDKPKVVDKDINVVDWLLRFGMIGSLWLIIAVMTNDGSLDFYLLLLIPSFMLFKLFKQLENMEYDENDN